MGWSEALLVFSTSILTAVLTLFFNTKLEGEKAKLRMKEKIIDKKITAIEETYEEINRIVRKYKDVVFGFSGHGEAQSALMGQILKEGSRLFYRKLYLDSDTLELVNALFIAMRRASTSFTRNMADATKAWDEAGAGDKDASDAYEKLLDHWRKEYGFEASSNLSEIKWPSFKRKEEDK